MDITTLKSQPREYLQQELIDHLNEQGNLAVQTKFQIQDYSILQVLDLFDIKKKDIELKNIKGGKKFQYKLLKSQKQNNNCYAFDFNTKGNILFVACKQCIVVYFNGYINDVCCLHFMKKSNSFVSGSVDNSIIIWELDKFCKWSINTCLEGHKNWVLCIVMNRSEDLLISGSFDNTVKFWRKIDNEWSYQQTINLEDYSCSLSLNEQEEKLISCGNMPLIQVIQKKQDQTWSIVQTIQVTEKGSRLYFLNDYQLIFQPYTKDFIEMYYFDNELRQFKKHKNFHIQNCEDCDWLFPIRFIQDLKILIIKHGQFINIFTVQDDGDINLIETIELEHVELYGNLTNDGKYLATWDFNTKEIQIRKLKYLE